MRSTKGYKEWRLSVLKEGKKKCKLCGSKERLEVDHIKPLALYPKLALDVNNGRVLCRNCHKKTDTYGSFSRFKGDSPIHPILAGDLLFKLQSLPQIVEIKGKPVGFSLAFKVKTKKWQAGYRFARIDFTINEPTIEDAVDGIFDKLRYSFK